MVLGELQEQIGVSCMEQGRLLFALRKRYAQAFNTMQEANADMMKRLATGRNQRERLGQSEGGHADGAQRAPHSHRFQKTWRCRALQVRSRRAPGG